MLKIEVDLVLRNGMYLDVYNRKFIKGDIAIDNGKIIGINEDYKGKKKET